MFGLVGHGGARRACDKRDLPMVVEIRVNLANSGGGRRTSPDVAGRTRRAEGEPYGDGDEQKASFDLLRRQASDPQLGWSFLSSQRTRRRGGSPFSSDNLWFRRTCLTIFVDQGR